MPGILPMKVIKVAGNSQARIAQACDRCRSKKIRCDGIRPSCTQCINVGFECKTSDKLSRRAFPRGYTESLEERVRMLEAEVRELKDLLDEKDEKIDMLSRMHSLSPPSNPSPRRASKSPSPAEPSGATQDKEDTFKVQQPPLLLDDENRDTYFVGSSSGRAFVGMSASTLPSHAAKCIANIVYRGVQTARPGDWQVMCRCQFQHFLRHGHEAGAVALIQTRHLVQGTASSCVGPDDQHLLPRMGSTVSNSAPAYFLEIVRDVCF